MLMYKERHDDVFGLAVHLWGGKDAISWYSYHSSSA